MSVMSRLRRPKDPSELSATEWVRQQLIDDIVAGRLRPGERLCEVKIATRLGCSRTPVREAFRHLGALGLAIFEKNRGGSVVRIERVVMSELFEALAETAAACAGLAATRSEGACRSIAGRDWPLAASPAANGAVDDLLSAVFQACGNRPLAEGAAAIRCRLLPYWRLLGEEALRWSATGLEAQAEILRAIGAGDGNEARRAMRAFILAARDMALAAIPASALP
jgi:DNA-binding GntR family transcriptional regulator